MVLAGRDRRLYARHGPRWQRIRLDVATEDVAAAGREARLDLARVPTIVVELGRQRRGLLLFLIARGAGIRHKPSFRIRLIILHHNLILFIVRPNSFNSRELVEHDYHAIQAE